MRTPKILSLTLLLGLAGFGCGSSEPAAPTHAEATSGGEGEAHAEGHEHPALPPDLAAFHEVLAPVWHQDPGDGRAHAACDASQDFMQFSANVEAGDDLRAASRHLAAVCGSADAAAIEEALAGVHQAFHDVMEAREGGEDAAPEAAPPEGDEAAPEVPAAE